VPEEEERSTATGGVRWVKQGATRQRECEGELELPVVGAKGQAAIGGAGGPQGGVTAPVGSLESRGDEREAREGRHEGCHPRLGGR
jgi:hypothetical protein